MKESQDSRKHTMHMKQNNSEEIVMKTKRWMAVMLCLSVLAAGVMSLSGCGTKVQAANLMEGIAAKPVSGRTADDTCLLYTSRCV